MHFLFIYLQKPHYYDKIMRGSYADDDEEEKESNPQHNNEIIISISNNKRLDETPRARARTKRER